MEIRKIRSEDFTPVLKLSAQMGYSIDDEGVANLSKLSTYPEHLVLVAVSSDTIVGYIHAFKTYRITSKPFYEIGGLLVDENHRRRGIGKALIDAFFKELPNGIEVRVRSNEKRLEAFQFYASLGFEVLKRQVVFKKEI
ncbi:MAG: GNAT family N-acetyltransferase [Saprospiraceae bacterium]